MTDLRRRSFLKLMGGASALALIPKDALPKPDGQMDAEVPAREAAPFKHEKRLPLAHVVCPVCDSQDLELDPACFWLSCKKCGNGAYLIELEQDPGRLLALWRSSK